MRKIGELDFLMFGLSAGLDPVAPVVPKGVASGVGVIINVGGRNLTPEQAKQTLCSDPAAPAPPRRLGVEGVLSGAGLAAPIPLPNALLPALPDPLLLPLPAFDKSGDYKLENVRVTCDGVPVIDVFPRSTIVKVIEQVLVTSVKTRELTLAELKERGIQLDSSSYKGFEFTMALQLQSRPVTFSMPVVFDESRVIVPRPLSPPAPPVEENIQLPEIVPLMLEVEDPEPLPGEEKPVKLPLQMPDGRPIRIPAIIVIPGNVGFLKGHFSAQLFVANGAPEGTTLTIRDVDGTIELPKGPDGKPLLTIATRRDGTKPLTMRVRGVGPDGEPETADDVEVFKPSEQGQAEWVLVGEEEGFHPIKFDVAAILDGLPIGPVKVKGTAKGGVLVRNAQFNMSFNVPTVIRRDEPFSMFVTVTNIGQGIGNDIRVAIDQAAMSGIRLGTTREKGPDGKFLPETGKRSIPTLKPGESETLELFFEGGRTGQVVASYLRFNTLDGSKGTLQFRLAVTERGEPLSPDTLYLHAAVDKLPEPVVRAALRVLGQAWSNATAPSGTLPQGVLRISRTVVVEKVLAVSEAGLRAQLGQSPESAVRDILLDLWGGPGGVPDRAFDQLLRNTDAGQKLADAIGAALAVEGEDGARSFEKELAELAASGPSFLSFAMENAPDAQLVDKDGNTLARAPELKRDLAGGVVLGLGEPQKTAGIVAGPSAFPYTFKPGAAGPGSLTFVGIDGGPKRATWDCDTAPELKIEPATEDMVTDVAGGCPVEVDDLPRSGPKLISATVVGQRLFGNARSYGFHIAFVFDRVVDADSAATTSLYQFEDNKLLGAKRQLSGRLVFGNLEQPEGPHVPRTVTVGAVTDEHGTPGAPVTMALGAKLDYPGAVVTGRVLHSDGRPVATGEVFYENFIPDPTCLEGKYEGMAKVPLKSDGRYEFRYVWQDPCGFPWRMNAQDPTSGALRTVANKVWVDGEHQVHDIVLLGRGAVQGVVKDGTTGGVVPNARVAVFSVIDPQTGGSSTTDGDGKYQVGGVTVGPVNVVAGNGQVIGSNGGRIDRAGTVATINVTLAGAGVRVSGRVFKVEDGAQTPLPNVHVIYYRRIIVGNEIDLRPSGLATTLDKGPDDPLTGTFVIDKMPAAEYRLEAILNERDKAHVDGLAVAGQQLQKDLVIVVPDADTAFATVTGKVVLPNGQPAADVIVTLDGRGALTKADGLFELRGVLIKPGIRSILARSRDGKRTGTVAVEVTTALVPNILVRVSGLGTAAFKVLNAAGTAQSGVPVGIGCSEQCECFFKLTDGEGIARFPNLPLASVAGKAIHVDGTAVDIADGSVVLTQDGNEVLTTLRFAGFGEVFGRVINPDRDGVVDNSPVHGAELALSSLGFDAQQCRLVRKVTHEFQTLPDGEFRFTKVNVGSVSIAADHFVLGKAGARGDLVAHGESVRLDVKYVHQLAGVLSGVVYLPDGVTPAGPGIEVTIAGGGRAPVTVRTQPDSRYRFAAIFPKGSYDLKAADPETGLTGIDKVRLEIDKDLEYDVRLNGRGTVRVRVLDMLDHPVPNALVKLEEGVYPFRTFETALDPSEEGVVTFEGVTEGAFVVIASDVVRRGGRATGIVPGPGTTVEVAVRMTVTTTVDGRFLMPNGAEPENPTPIPNGTMKMIANGRFIGQFTSVGSGPDVGKFRFQYVPAGNFTIEGLDPLSGRAGVASASVTKEDDKETDADNMKVDVMAQSIGTVKGAIKSNGVLYEGVVYLTLVSGSYRVRANVRDGAYEIDGVPEGRVVVTASLGMNGFLSGTASGTLIGEGGVLTLDVALRSSAEVTGRVEQINAAGERVAGPTSLVTIQVGGAGGGTLTTFTNELGEFRFEQVPAGKATLTADVLTGEDRGRAVIDVPEGEPIEAVITLNGTGTLLLKAVDDQDVPIQGTVSINGQGAFPYNMVRFVTADPAGLAVPDVLAGPVTLSLSHLTPEKTILRGSAQGEVKRGEVTVVTVKIQPSGTIKGIALRSSGAPAYGAGAPAFGANVIVKGAWGIPTQAQSDGSFDVSDIPLPADGSPAVVQVEITDPFTQGMAKLKNLSLTKDGLDLGTIVLDDAAPIVRFIQPAPASTLSSFGTPLVLEVRDPGSSGLDLATFLVGQQGPASFVFDSTNNTATGTFPAASGKLGANRLKAKVQDVAGNVTETFLDWTVTGGSVKVQVENPDGSKAGADMTVRVGASPAGKTNTDGIFIQGALRAGTYAVTATDPAVDIASVPVDVTITDGQVDAPVTVRLPQSAKIHGTVTRPHLSQTVDNVLVKSGVREARTNAQGFFDLGSFKIGTYTVTATAPNGDKGESLPVNVHTPGQSFEANIRLNGIGSVTVEVRDAQGALVDGADVVLKSSSRFATSPYTGTTVDGTVTFPNVLAGTLDATATLGVRDGRNNEMSVADNGSVAIPIALEGVGSITGRLLEADGITAVVGATVKLSRSKNDQTTTGANGAFTFNEVPFGNFDLNVIMSNGDRGHTAGALTSTAPDATADIRLNGIGTVRVLVKDSADQIINGATVRVVSDAPFSVPVHQGTTSGGLPVVFDNVLAGRITATATFGSLNGKAPVVPLTPNGSLDVEAILEDVGTVAGKVLNADGSGQGVEGVTVVLFGKGEDVTDADGRFEFTSVRLGTYWLQAKVGGRLRAQTQVTLTSTQPDVVKDLTLVGVGTVGGRVTLNGTGVVDANVTLTSKTPTFGGTFPTVKTVAGGQYTIANVPIGEFDLAAASGPNQGDVKGQFVRSNGEQVTVDVALAEAALTVPTGNINDANGWNWQIKPDGSWLSSYNVAAASKSPSLTIVGADGPSLFTGPCVSPCSSMKVPTEEGQREIILKQPSLLQGLEVTRKVFIPRTGYFNRQLELLRNPGAAPITVDVRIETKWAAPYQVAVAGSSSGDTAAGADDQWLVMDDSPASDYDYVAWHFSPFAVAFGGPGGAVAATPTVDPTKLTLVWPSVTVPPGETVALMHVWSAQANRARGSATASRLTQLPPELLAGLNAEEAGQIRNFAVPADLQSTLPVVHLDGMITGRVLAGDGETPITSPYESASANFQSRAPYYGLIRTIPQPSDGTYEVRPTPSSGTFVPRDGYDVRFATTTFSQPRTALVSAPSFPANGVVDLTRLPGRVWSSSSIQVTNGVSRENLEDNDLGTNFVFAQPDAAGSTGEKTPWVELLLPHDVAVHEIVIRGRRDGWRIHRARLQLFDAAGVVRWTQDVDLPVPLRDADVAVADPSAGGPVAGVRRLRLTSLEDFGSFPSLSELRLRGETPTGPTGLVIADAVFSGTGLLEGFVQYDDGRPMGAARVKLTTAEGSETFTVPSTGDLTGFFRFPIVGPGPCTLTATHPLGGTAAEATCTVDADKKAVQNIKFAPLGEIRGFLLSASATAVAGSVTVTGPVTRTVTASATQGYQVKDIPPSVAPARYSVTATDSSRSQVKVTQEVDVAAGPPTVLDFMFPPVAHVTVTVLIGGQPAGGVWVCSYSEARPAWGHCAATATTGAAKGMVTLQHVPGPAFSVRAQNAASSPTRIYGQKDGTISGEGVPVDVTIDAPGVATVSGMVRLRTGSPVAATVYLLSDDPDQPVLTAHANASTGFNITDVPVGTYRLRAELWVPDYETGERAVAVVSHAQPVSADVSLSRGVVASGKRELWVIALEEDVPTTMTARGVAVGTTAALWDTYLELYAPDGSLAAANDDVSGSDRNSGISIAPAVGGDYVVSVRGTGTLAGGYSLRLAPAGSSTGPFTATAFRRVTAHAAVHGRAVLEPDPVPPPPTSGPSLEASPDAVAPGGTVTVSWSQIAAPTATDWVGTYVPAAADTAYGAWQYTSCSGTSAPASGSCSFTLPSTPGVYEFRLFASNGYTRLATSRKVFVGVSPERPAANETVYLSFLDQVRTATSHADGAYLLPVAPAATEVTAELRTPSGRRLVSTTGTTGAVDTVLDLSLTKPSLGRVDVTATCDGQPCEGVAVTVTSTHPRADAGLLAQSGTIAGGTAGFPEVPVGTITAIVTHPQLGQRSKGGELSAGGVLTLPFQLISNGGAIDGVVRLQGTGVAGAVVELWSGGQRLDAMASGDGGAFQFQDVPAGSHEVRASYQGSAGEEPVNVAAGETTPITIDLPAVGTVVGTVKTREGAAVQGSVAVSVLDADGAVMASTTTTTGAYQLNGVELGALTVRADLTATDSGVVVTSRAEAAGALSQHGQSVTIDVTTPVATLATSERELWEFDGTAGQALDVFMRSRANGATPAQPNPRLFLYLITGEAVGSDDETGDDANARLTTTLPASASYVIVARSATNQVGGYHLATGGEPPVLIRPFEGAAVRVRSVRQDTGTAIAGASIRLRRTASFYGFVFDQTVSADSAGFYEFTSLPAGTYALSLLEGGVAVAEQQFDAAIGDKREITLTKPSTGTVRVTVRLDGNLLGNRSVTVVSNNPHAAASFATKTAFTSNVTGTQKGIATFTTFPTGEITAQTKHPVSGAPLEVKGTLATGATLDLTFNTVTPPPSNVTGKVVAADGVTPVPNASVALGSLIRTTDDAGAFSFLNVAAGTYSYSASWPSSDATHSKFGSIIVDGSGTILDVTLAIAIVRGRVTTHLDEPVAAQVDACAFYDWGGSPGCRGTTSGSDGRYEFFGLPSWWEGLTIRVSARLASYNDVSATQEYLDAPGAETKEVDLKLPATATVEVSVVDGTTPVASGQAVLRNESASVYRTLPIVGGLAEFPFVKAGDYQIFVSDAEDIPGRLDISFDPAGQTAFTVSLVPTVTLTGVVLDPSGVPVAGAQWMEASVFDVPAVWSMFPERWTRQLNTADNGTFSLRAPAGVFNLVVTSDPPAAVEGQTAAGQTPPFLELTQGSHVHLAALNGPQGGYCVGPECWPGAAVPLPSSVVPDLTATSVVSAELNGRQFRSLRAVRDGLHVRRLQYVPESGAFYRTVVLFTNTTAVAKSVPVSFRSNLAGEDRSIIWTSSGDGDLALEDEYAVVSAAESTGRAAVLWGRSATSLTFHAGGDPCGGECGWENAGIATNHLLDIPAGQSRALMYFIVAPDADDESFDVQVDGLFTLSDPLALAGLTTAERAAIQNWTLPAADGATVTVHVADETSGGMDAVAAPVRLTVTNAAGETIFDKSCTTAAAGRCSLGSVPLGPYRAQVLGPDDIAIAEAAGEITSIDEVLEIPLVRPGIGQVTVQVTLIDGTPVANQPVTVASTNVNAASSFANQATTTGEEGASTLAYVPSGQVIAATEYGGRSYGSPMKALPDTGAVTLDITIDPNAAPQGDGHIAGVVTDDLGDVVAGAVVQLGVGGPTTTTSASGQYQFADIAPGNYVVTAAFRGRTASRPVTVASGETAGGDIQLPAPAAVRVKGVRDDGALAQGEVTLFASQFEQTLSFDAQGEALFPRVPPGTFSVHYDNPPDLGWHEGDAPQATETQVTLPIGNRRMIPVDLTGENARPRLVWHSADVAGPEPSCLPSCGNLAEVNVAVDGGDPVEWRFELTGGTAKMLGSRETALGPRSPVPGLRVTRRVYVPPSGDFVRWVDLYRNVTGAPITLDSVFAFRVHGSEAPPSVVTTSSGSDDVTGAHYVVTTDGTEQLIVVTSNGAAAVPPNGVVFTPQPSQTIQGAHWNGVTIPPGETIAFMHFVTEAPAGDVDGAIAKAESLMNLAPSDALSGLTDQEKQEIVNFSMPVPNE